ncbi:MAG TPA: amidohydrolase family protein [Burkholderiaceae bacterium]|nr:amidohydrolase family protein [Burkholderiaceae bacterium]
MIAKSTPAPAPAPVGSAPARIVDAHHHIWRRSDLAWLNGPMQPRIFGEYESIRRDYPIAEFLSDVRPCGVTESVYVQANWPVDKGLDEAQWVQSVADGYGWPQAIVAYADFGRDDIDSHLDALASLPGVRGIRQQLHWHRNPQYRFASRPDLMADASWRRGFARLARRGWLFELQIFAGQMDEGVRLAKDFAEQLFVLEHAGMLEDRSAEGFDLWRRGMRELARCPNVHVKLSGLGTFVHSASPELMRPVVQETIEIFGAGRCMYGSNFPIEKIWTDYRSLFDAFRSCIADLSASEQAAILGGNAVQAYRL